MLYTSYFNQNKRLLENDLVPIAICGGLPNGYHGLWYPKLAPSWSIYSEWLSYHDTIRYRQRFFKEILSKRNPEQVYHELYELNDNSFDFAMICYEKPEDFCHRHLVAEWFTSHGIPCQEWIDPLTF